jgi:hypothetical protein
MPCFRVSFSLPLFVDKFCNILCYRRDIPGDSSRLASYDTAPHYTHAEEDAV